MSGCSYANCIRGYMALRAFVPPVERRGLVLIDPPCQEPGELDSAVEAIAQAWRKWANGIYALWYPVKTRETVGALARAVSRWGMKRALRLEFQFDPPMLQGPVARCGLFIVNPPFQLDDQAKAVLPWLASCLGNGQPGFSIDWLSEG